MIKKICLLLTLTLCLCHTIAKPWNAWLNDLKTQASSEGISPYLVDDIFKHWRPNKRVLRLDRSQPEHRVTFLQYRKKRGDAYRIKLGRRALKKHRALLNRVSRHFGVSPCFILSFWGLETCLLYTSPSPRD